MRTACEQGKGELLEGWAGIPAVLHSRTEEDQQDEAEQLEQAPAGTPGCIPEPF